MDQMKSYKELLERIQELVNKIDKAELSLDELFEMERLTAKLHERSIILRYKAFENKIGITKGIVKEVVEEVKEEPVTDVKKEKEEPNEEKAELEFAILDEPEEDGREETHVEEETIEFSPPQEEVIEEEIKVEEPEPVQNKLSILLLKAHSVSRGPNPNPKEQLICVVLISSMDQR